MHISWWIYFAVVVLNVKEKMRKRRKAQYSIYIPVVGSAPYLETGHNNTTCTLVFIVNFELFGLRIIFWSHS